MRKEIIIAACIAGILGTLEILKSDPFKYGAVALLGYTAFITLGELSPPKQGQVVKQQTQRPMQQTIREKPKSIWDEFPKETTREEVKLDETKKEPKFKIEDTNEEQNKIQGPEEMQEA